MCSLCESVSMCTGKIQNVNSAAFKNSGKDINQELLKYYISRESVTDRKLDQRLDMRLR